MLKPFLEQAADPMHMQKTGQASQLFGSAKKAAAATSAATTSSESSKPPVDEEISTHVERFNPEVKAELSALVNYCESKSLLSVNEHNLLVDTKDYFNQSEIKWSIAKNHIKLLVSILVKKLDAAKSETLAHRLAALNVLQVIALKRELAVCLLNDELFNVEFLPKIKETAHSLPDLKYSSMRLLSNICMHSSLSRLMLEKHQDFICKELVEFILIDTETDIDTLIHEASISFFYNLIPAYHLEKLFHESNALPMGCALLERLPKFKSSQRTTYRMLALLRSCLVRSHEVVDLAQSMDFDLSSYQGQVEAAAAKKSEETYNNDTYDGIVHNIDDLIHPHKQE
jgi:hypothetical protein